MKVLIVQVEEFNAPDDLQDGGWYNGHQYYQDKFGMPGEIIVGHSRRKAVKKLSQRQKAKLIEQIIIAGEVFK